ncbi:MAG: hypothetical protein ACYDG2_22140 [Ruminiclostridium sp.]
MANDKEQTSYQKLCEIVPLKLVKFVQWYCSPEETRPKWDDYKSNCGYVTWETAQEYPLRPDVQKALVYWKEQTFIDNQIKIYDKMLQKAMSGDVNASKFIMDFKFPKANEEDEATGDLKKRLDRFKKNKGDTDGTN